MSEQDVDKKREKLKSKKRKERYIPPGQLVRHKRNLKRKYLGKELMKYVRSRYFQLRLAKARELLVKEAVPPLKPSVWIKSKNGRPGYMKEDPRLKRAITAMKHEIRVAIAMDENVNPEFGPFEKKNITEIQVNSNSDASDEELEQNPTEEVAPQEVSLSTFLVRSQLFGNQSGDELEFEKDGTPLLIKVEKKSDDSDDDGEVRPTPSTYARGGNSGRAAALNSGPGPSMATETTSPTNSGSEHSESSEEDNAQPPKKETDASREIVAYKLLREISANPDTAIALIQALKSIKFEIPMDNGTSRRCGVDFMNIETPKNARIKRIKRTHRKREKYPGRGKGSSGEGPGQESAQTPTTNEPDKNPTATAKKDAKNQEVENADQDVLDLDIDVDSVTFDEQTGKEPESKDSAGNGNNNSNKTPIKDRTPHTNKKTTKSPDHRKTCFFPSPKSRPQAPT